MKTQTEYPEEWRFVRLTSPLGKLYGSVVEADDDVLGVAWDIDKSAADLRALNEGIERSALHQTSGELIRSSAHALGDRALNLSDRVRFSESQRAASPRLSAFDWDQHSETTWTKMQSPYGERLVPVDLARIRLEGADPARPKPMTSIGTACGPDWSTALDKALLEVVERHEVAKAVYCSTKAIRVDPSTFGAADIAAELGSCAELWTAVLPSRSFGVTVAVAVVRGLATGLPQAAFGTAAAASVQDAIRSAALEAVHVFHLGWRLLRRATPLGTPTTINQRALWWASHGEAHFDDYFSSDARAVLPKEPARDESAATTVARELARAEHDWAYANITPPWATGVVVARVVAPSLLHLQINEFPFLIAPRFRDHVETYQRGRRNSQVPHPFV